MNDTTLPSRRRKTGVKKGFGLYDWKVLLRSSRDLAMRNGAPLRQIQMEEVALHNKVHDGWMVLFGKVYNVGPYLHYHPGGVDIMKPFLGKDGSKMYEKYHRWVGVDSLVGKLLLGALAETESKMDMLPPKPRGKKLESLLKADGDDDEKEEEEIVNPWEEKS